MKIGILGGTFSPIHLGHLFVANYIADYLDLQKVVFIPSGTPPHKKEYIDKIHRANMVKSAIRDNDKFVFCDYEIKKDGYSYTYDTMNYLMKKYPKDDFFYMIGQDAFFLIDEWYKSKELLDMLHFIVVTRGIDEKQNPMKKYGRRENVEYVHTPNIEISSTDIRKRVKEGKNIRYYVDEGVQKYIKDNSLYLD